MDLMIPKGNVRTLEIIIITKKRNRLCNEKIDKLWMVYCNQHEKWAVTSPILTDLYPKKPSII